MSKIVTNVLVDFDGTLHDTDLLYAARLDGLFGREGEALYHMFLSEIHRGVVHKRYPERHDDMDLHLRLLLEHLGEPYNSENIDLLASCFKAASEDLVKRPVFYPEAAAFLDRAVKADLVLCLSTGGGNTLQKAEVIARVLGRDYFSEVIGEELLGFQKHDPSYYREALRRLGWRAEMTASVGDTLETDILPARTVGIRTIWLDRNSEGPASASSEPDYTATDLLSALEYLLDM
jgi:FMN phosphatase YigB (HAD superfamily)